MVRRIIFDLDDTLLDTGKYYHRQLHRFVEKIQSEFEAAGSADDILAQYYEFDCKDIEKHGYDKAHFPGSMVKTWKYYCDTFGREIRKKEVEECAEIGWDVYSKVPEQLDDIEETLQQLYVEYELILYTMGDAGIQFEKIEFHNLNRWFDQMHVVPFKDTNYLKMITGSYPPEYTMVVGDSLRGEIKPAIELGMQPVFRESNFPWSFHEVEIEAEFPKIQELPELFNYLS